MTRADDVEARAVDAFESGRAHEAQGDLASARHLYVEAADFGHRAAAAILGVLEASESVDIERYSKRKRRKSYPELVSHELHITWWGTSWALAPAERLWRRAFGGIDAASAREVGQQLDWDPECVETEFRLRAAYEAGDPMAGYRLGSLLEGRGSDVEREYGWRKEADRVYQAVRERTTHAAERFERRVGRWYPARWLRRVVETGRAPLGTDAPAVRAHFYATVRGMHRNQTGGNIRGFNRNSERYVRQWLEWEHEAGEPEATFLIGTFRSARRADDARLWLRLAAEAGHRQAAFELGLYEQAADAGYPAAAFDLAIRALDSGDLAAAESASRRAARGGHLHAAALLRILLREPRRATRTDDVTAEDRRVPDLLAAWDELSGLAPDRDRCIDYLAGRSGVPRPDIEHMRRVRNQCAHPADRGWPSPSDIDLALETAADLRRRLNLRPRGKT